MINPQVKKPIVAKKKKIKTPSTAKSIVDPRDAVRKEQKDSTSAAALQARIAKLEKQLAAKPKMPMPPAMMDNGGLLNKNKTDVEMIKNLFESEENKNKDFIQRIIDPRKNTNVVPSEKGKTQTHLMSFDSDQKGNHYIYPRIQKDEKGTYKDFGRKAFDRALSTGEFIKFSPKEKEKGMRISKDYKKAYPQLESFGKEKKFDDGGLLQQGGTKDPVSGNDVPIGSTKKEVRDDIPAQLSEGEFVFPADVVRFIGLNNLMKLRQEAKEGLGKMDRMGQMGNSEEATEDDTGEFDSDIDSIIKEVETEMASQGLPKKSIETTSETEEALPVIKKSIMEIN